MLILFHDPINEQKLKWINMSCKICSCLSFWYLLTNAESKCAWYIIPIYFGPQCSVDLPLASFSNLISYHSQHCNLIFNSRTAPHALSFPKVLKSLYSLILHLKYSFSGFHDRLILTLQVSAKG